MSYPYSQKYGNKKVLVDGISFDSKREAHRYTELKMMVRSGEISDLELQKEYELIPSQYEKTSGQKGKPKCLERSVKYIADFVYKDNRTGECVVEDTKGVRTPEYIIKRKLLLYIYGIRIKEI